MVHICALQDTKSWFICVSAWGLVVRAQKAAALGGSRGRWKAQHVVGVACKKSRILKECLPRNGSCMGCFMTGTNSRTHEPALVAPWVSNNMWARLSNQEANDRPKGYSNGEWQPPMPEHKKVVPRAKDRMANQSSWLTWAWQMRSHCFRRQLGRLADGRKPIWKGLAGLAGVSGPLGDMFGASLSFCEACWVPLRGSWAPL